MTNKPLDEVIEGMACRHMEQFEFLVQLPYSKLTICDAVERDLPIVFKAGAAAMLKLVLDFAQTKAYTKNPDEGFLPLVVNLEDIKSWAQPIEGKE